MRITGKDLKSTIASLLKEAQHYEEIKLLNGETCTYGSAKHLADLKRAEESLSCLRNQHRRGTATRSVYAASLARLKTEIKKISKKNEVSPLPDGLSPKLESDDLAIFSDGEKSEN